MTLHLSDLKVCHPDSDTAYRDQMRFLLRQTLLSRDLTQAEFARMVGVSEKHLSQVLTGKVNASTELYDTWARCLGMQWVVALRELPGHKDG